MSDEQAVQDSIEVTPNVPWWKREIKLAEKRPFSKFTRWLLIITLPFILLNLFTVKPLWELGWRTRFYCLDNLFPVQSASGVKYAAGAWASSKRIVVYGAPGVSEDAITKAYDGMRAIVDEVGLDLRVERISPPADALASLQAATARGGEAPGFDYNKFMARRLDDRGAAYAEMVLMQVPFIQSGRILGLSNFASGLAVLREHRTGTDLASHEGAHLLGYSRHDDEMPYFIAGYSEALIPMERDTLMMPLPSTNSTLSPRAHNAIVNFWRGYERDGRRYFK
jgi:hypothetical protein